jgi:hypothetical protein
MLRRDGVTFLFGTAMVASCQRPKRGDAVKILSPAEFADHSDPTATGNRNLAHARAPILKSARGRQHKRRGFENREALATY